MSRRDITFRPIDGVSADRTPPRPTCRYHCTSCGEHFSSLVAFDAHRRGGYEVRGARHCIWPDDALSANGRRMLRVQTEKAVCRLSGTMALDPVSLWEAA